MADLDDDATLRREIEALKLELVRFVLLEARERSEKGDVVSLSPAVQAALTRGAETAMSAQIGQSGDELNAAMTQLREDARAVSLLLSGVKDQIASQTAIGTKHVNDAMARLKREAAGISSALGGIAGHVAEAERFGAEAGRKLAELTDAIDLRTQQSKEGFAAVNALIGNTQRSAAKIDAAAKAALTRLKAANLDALPGSEVEGDDGNEGKNSFAKTCGGAHEDAFDLLEEVQGDDEADDDDASGASRSEGQGRETASHGGATRTSWMKRPLGQKLKVFFPDSRSLGWLVALVLAGFMLWQSFPKDTAHHPATAATPVAAAELAAQLWKPVGAIPDQLKVTRDDIATGYPVEEPTDEPGKKAKADARQRLPERLATLRGQISVAVDLRGKICKAKQHPLPSDEKGALAEFDKILPLLVAIQGNRGPMTPEERAFVASTLDWVSTYPENLKSSGAGC